MEGECRWKKRRIECNTMWLFLFGMVAGADSAYTKRGFLGYVWCEGKVRCKYSDDDQWGRLQGNYTSGRVIRNLRVSLDLEERARRKALEWGTVQRQSRPGQTGRESRKEMTALRFGNERPGVRSSSTGPGPGKGERPRRKVEQGLG